MRARIITIVLFLGCFIVGLILFDHILVSSAGDDTSEMDHATLPLMYVVQDKENINEMHGFTSAIDASLLRDSVTPLDNTNKIELLVDGESDQVRKLHYEVRSSDASSLVEDGDIKSFSKDKHGDFRAEINVRMQLKPTQDYILKLTLSGSGGVDTIYYTRLIPGEQMHVNRHLDFIREFHDALFDKKKAENVRQYMECDPSKTTNNLCSVDITSSFEALTYADMAPQKVTDPVTTITDIAGDVACMQMKYVVSSGKENAEYYFMTEDYKVRYTTTRMYLLSYNRTMKSVYDRSFVSKSQNGLKLGIEDENDVIYATNKNCKKVAFVKNQELYFYDYSATKVTKVFSFLEDGYMDDRDNYDKHDIQLIQLDEKGNVTFAVYGYMNRGRHEGQNGVLFYRYKAEDNQIEEVAFVLARQPFAALKEDVQQAVYMNKKNEIYLCLDGILHTINTKENKIYTEMKNVTGDTVVSSHDCRLLASVESLETKNNHQITLENLETKASNMITANAGESLRLIGFVGDDLVFGKVKEEDIVGADSKASLYPMYEVDIVNEEGKVVKNYTPSNEKDYVMSAVVESNLVQLNISKRSGDRFEEQDQQYIIGSEADENSTVVLSYVYSNDRYKELYMVFPSDVYVSEVPELLVTKETRIDNNRSYEISEEEESLLRYFVYVNGTIVASYTNVGEAIRSASEQNGVVVNTKQKTIWEKSGVASYGIVAENVPVVISGKKKTSMQACVAMILSFLDKKADLATLVAQKSEADTLLSEYLGKDGVDLTGVSLSDAVYYICQGSPLIAKRNDGTFVLITSYNESLVKYTDPVTGEIERKEFEDMEKEFESAGNVFYSYVK